MNRNEKLINLIKATEVDAILLSSEENMHYFCGFSPSEGRILATKECIYHFVDSRYIINAQRHSKNNGMTVIETEKSFNQSINDLINKHSVNTLGFEEEKVSVSDYMKMSEVYKVKLVPLHDAVSRLRIHKDKEELEMIIAAQRIAESAFSEILNHLSAGKSEHEMAALLDYCMMKSGSHGLSFSTILISGVNTSMPHGVPSDKIIENGDFVTMDFGATYNGYHSDMTRTVAIGSASDEMIDVYETVLVAQNAAINFIKKTVKCSDAHNVALKIISDKGYGNYFKHGLGHGVGLEIHEGYTCSPRSKDVFEAGVVMTVEPGIYIPEKFGVRIEDMLYIEENNPINITKTPKELIIL